MPPPKRRRVKVDRDVVKTEKDYRRASGKEGENDFDNEETPPAFFPGYTYQDLRYPGLTNRATSDWRRSRSRRSIDPNNSQTFPFLRLPPELRNMIYRYLVVSTSDEPIRLDGGEEGKYYKSGGIRTAILTTTKQIYAEAVKIMYDENKCIATYSRTSDGISYRYDDTKTKSSTARTLRDGREVGMTKYRGYIYNHLVQKLKRIEFRVIIFPRDNFCDHIALRMGTFIRDSLYQLWVLLRDWLKESKEKTAHNRLWEFVVDSKTAHDRKFLKAMLEPLMEWDTLSGSVLTALQKGMITLKLEGQFPKQWEKTFRKVIKARGFSSEGVVAVEPQHHINLRLLLAYMDEDIDEAFFWF